MGKYGSSVRKERVSAMDDELERLAREGDAEAMCELGFRALEVRDYHRAAQWLEPAAKRGIPRAQHAFGLLHNGSFGLPADWEAYVTWLTKAAEGGYLLSCHSLAFAYDHGIGVERNIHKAVRWYLKFMREEYCPPIARHSPFYRKYDRKGSLYRLRMAVWRKRAAQQGGVRWQRLTGEEYEEGWLLPSNMEKALYWYRLAAAQGDFRATFHRKQLEAKWATAEAEIFAARKAVERGDSWAQLIFGRAYFLGLGLHQSFKKAAPLLLSAAEQGRAEAMYWLAKLTKWKFLAHLAPGDPDTWLRRAAEAGYAEAQWELSYNPDCKDSDHWARLAAAQGHEEAKSHLYDIDLPESCSPKSLLKAAKKSPYAMQELANNYRYGEDGFEQSLEKAAEWQIKLVECCYTTQDAYSILENIDHGEECFKVGELYLGGKGVPQSDAEALKCYRKGVAMGDVLAAWRIGQFYEEGRGGLEQSYEEALKWYHCAFGEMDSVSWQSISCIINGHDDVEAWDLAYPLISYQSDVAERYRARADAGDANAQWITGLRYEFGQGFEESAEKAALYYSRSAEQNNVVGMCLLGHAYQYGVGVPTFGSLAWEWFILAKEQQLSEAESTLPNRLEESFFI